MYPDPFFTLCVVGDESTTSITVWNILDAFHAKQPVDLLVLTEATGVPTHAGEWANKRRISSVVFDSYSPRYRLGKAAPELQRMDDMLRRCKLDCILFLPTARFDERWFVANAAQHRIAVKRLNPGTNSKVVRPRVMR